MRMISLQLCQAINLRGRTFYSEPSGGYVHHRHNFMVIECWDLRWAVIEEQFLSLWKNKGEFEAAARSSSISDESNVTQVNNESVASLVRGEAAPGKLRAQRER